MTEVLSPSCSTIALPPSSVWVIIESAPSPRCVTEASWPAGGVGLIVLCVICDVALVPD